jgi:hypothetical protein
MLAGSSATALFHRAEFVERMIHTVHEMQEPTGIVFAETIVSLGNVRARHQNDLHQRPLRFMDQLI